MTTNSFSIGTHRTRNPLSYWISTLALAAGLILSFLSWLELCVEHCSANQNYLIFGLPFAIFGMTFFTVITVLHALSLKYPFLRTLVGWGLASALGAEMVFIGIQKYHIGRWCPVCLSIAFTLTIAALAYSTPFLKNFIKSIKQGNRGELMKNIAIPLKTMPFFFLGLLLALVGITKIDPAHAAAEDMKRKIAFGQPNTPIEVYFISDWFCPACRKVEPIFEKLLPKMLNQSSIYFVDYPIHSKTLNYSPYNLAFLINNKLHYFEARYALFELAEKIDSPTDEDIAQAAKKANIPFKELSYIDIKSGLDFFDSVVKKNDLDSTPTIIIYNTKTKKSQKFEGYDEISEAKVMKAFETLSKQSK